MSQQQVRMHSRLFDSGIAAKPGPLCARTVEEIVQRLRVKALPLRWKPEARRAA
jgi:hypothetical protein